MKQEPDSLVHAIQDYVTKIQDAKMGIGQLYILVIIILLPHNWSIKNGLKVQIGIPMIMLLKDPDNLYQKLIKMETLI